MITLPYEFDTAAVWETIVKLVLGMGAVLLALIIASVVIGHLAAAVQMSLVLAVGVSISLIARNVAMGASGTLTEHEVIVHPVHVWGVPLRVPRGRYSIQGFRQILIDERLSRSSSQGLRSVARVYLVGTGGTPAIEVISDTSDVAAASAQQLAALLRLEIVRGKLGVA